MTNDVLDDYINALTYEAHRELKSELVNVDITRSLLGEYVQCKVLNALIHDCNMLNLELVEYAHRHPQLSQWYCENISNHLDYFLENMPIISPYTTDPELYGNIWANLATQIIGVLVGNLMEDGV